MIMAKLDEIFKNYNLCFSNEIMYWTLHKWVLVVFVLFQMARASLWLFQTSFTDLLWKPRKRICRIWISTSKNPFAKFFCKSGWLCQFYAIHDLRWLMFWNAIAQKLWVGLEPCWDYLNYINIPNFHWILFLQIWFWWLVREMIWF